MNILLFGDVIGRPGRRALQELLPGLRTEFAADLVIANVENLAHGFGITPETIAELQKFGVDYFTSGNHIWKNVRGVEWLASSPKHVLRPANYPADRPGLGWTRFEVNGVPVCLINLIGQVFMKDEVASPFKTFDAIAAEQKDAVILVDFHAEATGEKRALGWYVDGRAAAVVGTHTHVQTTDAQIQTGGTAYLSDLGMCGAVDSSLGMDKTLVLRKVAYGEEIHLEPPMEPSEVVVSGALVTIDEATKQATAIERIDRRTTLHYT